MLENFYTTKMSQDGKKLQKRFAGIVSGKMRISLTLAIVTIVCALSLFVATSAAMASFDNDKPLTNEDTKKEQEEYILQAEPDWITDSTESEEEYILQANTQDLVWPCDSTSISAGFATRTNPVTKTKVSHNGVDIVCDYGDDVYAATGGIVTVSEYDAEKGNYIVIENDNMITLYAHLSEASVSAGDTVNAGQVIGKAGSTGMATGPHLHFEITVDGKYCDPAPMF